MSVPSSFLFIHDEGALDLSEPSKEHSDGLASPLWTGVTTPLASDDFSRILDGGKGGDQDNRG